MGKIGATFDQNVFSIIYNINYYLVEFYYLFRLYYLNK